MFQIKETHMRKVNLIALHCSDSPRPEHDSISVIRSWHLEKGWRDVGYHFFIRKDGVVEKGRDENEIGSHIYGHNRFSIGVCLSGRTFVDFHSPQFIAARELVLQLIDKYKLTKADVKLHRDFDPKKSCPNFSLKDFWQD